jgi:CheY-like chemotaxis protein
VLQERALDLNSVVTGLEGMLARLLGADVELETKLAADLGVTRADPGQIEQVVVNLAINARDAMPRGGRLRIETANAKLDADFAAAHVGAVPGEYLMVAVSDDGDGMDDATLARIWEPFFTTKPQGRGTGLGLSTVYGIVKQTGGSIWAYSEPGRGSTFKVYLPRIWEQAEASNEPAAAPRLVGSETVLLVEDEDIVRSLVGEMLEGAGYTVISAADAAEAERLAAEHTGSIELLMTDVVMPGMSGPVLAERLLPERPGLRVLFTSGYTEDAITARTALSEGTAFLSKPFTAADLAEKLRSLLDDEKAAA